MPPTESRPSNRPLAVLFACGLNAVRSPMAASLFSQIFGLDISRHKPVTFEELEDWEGLNFDLIVTLAPEAHHRALEITRTNAIDVEYWPTADPSAVEGSREQRLEAYREVRDQLLARIRQRFIARGTGNE
jgi:protein-tyrosine-phosphatase